MRSDRHQGRWLWRAIVLLVVPLAAGGCGNDDPETVQFDFARGDQGWVAGFADYPAGQEDFYELVAEYRPLPPELSSSQSALFISGNNHSDDLWMYYKGRVTGLDANRLYLVRFDLQLATAVPNGCVGVGGAPGEGVTVKAGATTREPEAVLEGSDLRMNIAKGMQANPGADALIVGDVANSVPCGDAPRWELKRLSSGPEYLEVETDANGSMWLFVGTDSGFEATTSVYYTSFTAKFDPV